jgi:hypothetical protein
MVSPINNILLGSLELVLSITLFIFLITFTFQEELDQIIDL